MHEGVKGGLALCVAAVLALAATSASAQTAVGFRGGLRMADLDTGQDADGLSTFVVGGYFGLGLSDRLALQIELAYGERGAQGVGIGDGTLDPAATPSDLTMRYIDVPILLRTGFPGDKFLPSFFVGPYAGFLVGCQITPEGEDARDCDAEGASPRFDPRSSDFGMVAGAGLDMAIGESTIFVDLRYTLGLLAIDEGNGSIDARHNGLEVTGGFAFPLGR